MADDHHHHAQAGGDARGPLLGALALNGGFLVAEASVGWWSGSLALLSDAAHMLGDVAALVLALGAAELARRGPSPTMTFGLHRVEVLGAFVNGFALFVVVGLIVWEAIGRLVGPPSPVAGVAVLVVGLLGLGVNLGSAWLLFRSEHASLNVRAAMTHMLADALGSVGAVVASGLILAGFPQADAAVSLLVAALVAWGAWSVTRDAGRVLLQLPPADLQVERLIADLLGLDGVTGVHDVHVWSLDGRGTILSAHLVSAEPSEAANLVEHATRLAHDRHGVEHSTFQVEAGGPAACLGRACGAHLDHP